MIRSLALASTSHAEGCVDTTTAAGLISPSTGDRDVEMSREIHTPEVNLVDVEMEDDFLPSTSSTPTIVVSILLT